MHALPGRYVSKRPPVVGCASAEMATEVNGQLTVCPPVDLHGQCPALTPPPALRPAPPLPVCVSTKACLALGKRSNRPDGLETT